MGDSIIIDAGEPLLLGRQPTAILSCRPAWIATQHQQIN